MRAIPWGAEVSSTTFSPTTESKHTGMQVPESAFWRDSLEPALMRFLVFFGFFLVLCC